MAAMLRQEVRDLRVEILDAPALQMGWRSLAAELDRRRPAYVAIGEEAVAVGVCSALGDGDRIISTHRGHGHCIAKGLDLKLMMAEIIGREGGYCRGRGGSMHITAMEHGMLGADAIGRDIAVRLLYGGRASLLVGICSPGHCVFFSVLLAPLSRSPRRPDGSIVPRSL